MRSISKRIFVEKLKYLGHFFNLSIISQNKIKYFLHNKIIFSHKNINLKNQFNALFNGMIFGR